MLLRIERVHISVFIRQVQNCSLSYRLSVPGRAGFQRRLGTRPSRPAEVHGNSVAPQVNVRELSDDLETMHAWILCLREGLAVIRETKKSKKARKDWLQRLKDGFKVSSSTMCICTCVHISYTCIYMVHTARTHVATSCSRRSSSVTTVVLHSKSLSPMEHQQFQQDAV